MTMRILRLLIHLYPAKYRSTHAEEMVLVLAETHAERQDLVSRVWFATREAIGLVCGAILAWEAHFLRHRQPHRAVPALGIDELPDEVQDAQVLLDDAIDRMKRAIAEKRFERARRYSHEEREARAALRDARRRYGLGVVAA
jgi:hypothetical protein